MKKKITLVFEFEQEDLVEFMEDNEIEDESGIEEWVFGEICQNQDFGFLTGFKVEEMVENQENDQNQS